MFSQISKSMEKQETAASGNADQLNAKIDTLTQAVVSLAAQVKAMQSAAAVPAAATAARAAPPAPPVDPMQQMRSEIKGLLQLQNYDAAFTKALSATTADMAVFACKNANLSDVLGGNTPALSQPILLCLMQQLGAVLVSSTDASDLQTELAWLQEIALTLDPTHENIQRHVPGVLQQLYASVNNKMAQGDPTLRRPLQMLMQVIRGMQR